MQENLNLIQKLAKIRAMSDAVAKSKRGYNYSYEDITEILANVTAGMKRYGVSLIPTVTPGTSQVSQNVIRKTKVDKTGKPYETVTTEMLYSADMLFRWVNDEHPEETIEVPWFVTGSQEDPSQAFGSGLTYCTRYFLTSYFQIARADSDVDAYRSKQQAAAAAEDKALCEEIISSFDAILREFLAGNPDKADETKKFISRYAKNANYLSIKEPTLAAKLKEDFENTYLKEK